MQTLRLLQAIERRTNILRLSSWWDMHHLINSRQRLSVGLIPATCVLFDLKVSGTSHRGYAVVVQTHTLGIAAVLILIRRAATLFSGAQPRLGQTQVVIKLY